MDDTQPGRAQVQRLTVDTDSSGQRLDNFLLRHLKGVPKTHVYRVIRSGEVRLNKGRAQADTRVAEGDELSALAFEVEARLADNGLLPNLRVGAKVSQDVGDTHDPLL